MSDVHSGLEAWRNIADSESRRNTVASYLPLILSAAGGLGVLPFMILRYMQGQWIAAGVDTVIVVGFAVLGTYVYKTGRTRFASIPISAFCVMGVLTTVYVIGAQQIYWAVPCISCGVLPRTAL